jgi:hypothetical protein
MNFMPFESKAKSDGLTLMDPKTLKEKPLTMSVGSPGGLPFTIYDHGGNKLSEVPADESVFIQLVFDEDDNPEWIITPTEPRD